MMADFGFPGMKVLIFGFAGDVARNPHAPHNIQQGCVAYTGTHDNNTVRGWFENEVSSDQRNLIFRYIGGSFGADNAHRIFIRLAMLSPAETVIVPMQDILGLGAEARMNRPGTSGGTGSGGSCRSRWRIWLCGSSLRLPGSMGGSEEGLVRGFPGVARDASGGPNAVYQSRSRTSPQLGRSRVFLTIEQCCDPFPGERDGYSGGGNGLTGGWGRIPPLK